MDKDQIRLEDITRILIGDAPPIFLFEVFLRTLVAYTALMITLRLLGKRMNGNSTVMEMAVILTLGAIVSVPMQAPERGILLGIMLLVLVIFFHRGINWLGFKYPAFEKIVHGKTALLIKDGVIQTNAAKETSIPNQQLFNVLRTKGVYHLGEVKRLYIEACGAFSLYKSSEGKPGLSTLPVSDFSINEILEKEPEVRACSCCGTLEYKKDSSTCSYCHGKTLMAAVKYTK